MMITTSWKKVYWDAPDLPEQGNSVLVYVEGAMYVAYLIISPSYTTGRKHIVVHPETKIFHLNEYDSCCRGNEISLGAKDFYWTELPKSPDIKEIGNDNKAKE